MSGRGLWVIQIPSSHLCCKFEFTLIRERCYYAQLYIKYRHN